jgi:hypothetical protein
LDWWSASKAAWKEASGLAVDIKTAWLAKAALVKQQHDNSVDTSTTHVHTHVVASAHSTVSVGGMIAKLAKQVALPSKVVAMCQAQAHVLHWIGRMMHLGSMRVWTVAGSE